MAAEDDDLSDLGECEDAALGPSRRVSEAERLAVFLDGWLRETSTAGPGHAVQSLLHALASAGEDLRGVVQPGAGRRSNRHAIIARTMSSKPEFRPRCYLRRQMLTFYSTLSINST